MEGKGRQAVELGDLILTGWGGGRIGGRFVQSGLGFGGIVLVVLIG